jgi:NADP-dependent 3-hydroxy acid dehydrogenase YdfG
VGILKDNIWGFRGILMAEFFFDLTGKVAIVTGASRGLGQYFSRALARAGADLAITGLNDIKSLDEFKNEIESLGRKVLSLQLDVREKDSIRLCTRIKTGSKIFATEFHWAGLTI